MHIKRFQAPTMLEAVKKVKAALGPDALVLETRTLRKGEGLFGVLGRPMVEVTAAVDHEAAAPPAARSKPEAGPARSTAAPDGLGREALRELAELRALTTELARGRVPVLEGSLGNRLAGKLLVAGLQPDHAWRFAQAAAARPDVTRTEQDALRAALCDGFDARLEPPRSDDGVEVELLVGPTGAGKTTTLAKLAAREKDEPGGVALLTTDTHRLGAAEQLERFAAAIDVPFGVAQNPEELSELIAARPARRVLVDSAGVSGSKTSGIGSLFALREASGPRARVRLVLAATADADQLRFERDRHAALEPDAMILTKLDEARSWAPAANLVLDPEAPPLLWMTTGQRVPEDLIVPEPVQFADALLRAGEST